MYKLDRKNLVLLRLLTSFCILCSAPDVGTQWTPIEANNLNLQYLHMIEPGNFQVKVSKNLGEKQFWDAIYFNENKPHPFG